MVKRRVALVTVIPEPEDNFDERFQRLGETLNATMQPFGLYLQSTVLLPEDELAQVGKSLVMADFVLGDLAFSDRVLHPDRYAEDDKTQHLMAEVGLDEDEAETIRSEWAQRLGRTESKEVSDDHEGGDGGHPETDASDGEREADSGGDTAGGD